MEEFMESIGIAVCVFLFAFFVYGFIVEWDRPDYKKGVSFRVAAILYLVLMSFSAGVHVGEHSKEQEEKPTVDAPEKEIEQGFIKQKEEE